MPKLVEYILKRSNNNIKTKSALDDGSCDSNENFKYLLQKTRIQPGIKVRKNSTIISLKNNSLRNREVYSQSKDLIKWKKSAESMEAGGGLLLKLFFSSIKRTYEEYASAIKYQNMIKEMILKVSLYNLFRRMA